MGRGEVTLPNRSSIYKIILMRSGLRMSGGNSRHHEICLIITVRAFFPQAGSELRRSRPFGTLTTFLFGRTSPSQLGMELFKFLHLLCKITKRGPFTTQFYTHSNYIKGDTYERLFGLPRTLHHSLYDTPLIFLVFSELFEWR